MELLSSSYPLDSKKVLPDHRGNPPELRLHALDSFDAKSPQFNRQLVYCFK
jgi:hypothetical protein